MYSLVVWKVSRWDSAINPKNPKKTIAGLIVPIHVQPINDIPNRSSKLGDSQYKTAEAAKHT
jgi:hypothetical protein